MYFSKGITKPCTQLHPAPSTSIQPNRAPSTSTQLISTSAQLHPPPPSSFQPPPSSLQHSQQCMNQNIARNWAITPNLGQNIKSCPFWLKNWHTWYIGGADSEFRLRFLKFRSQNSFLGKFGPKNSKLSVLSENWYSYYLKDADSESRLGFLKVWPQNLFLSKFGPKNSKLSVLSKNWYTWYLKDADSYSKISFLNFKSWFPSWANLGQKIQRCLFCLKIGIHGISRMLILIPTLVLWIWSPNFLFGQIWAN